MFTGEKSELALAVKGLGGNERRQEGAGVGHEAQWESAKRSGATVQKWKGDETGFRCQVSGEFRVSGVG